MLCTVDEHRAPVMPDIFGRDAPGHRVKSTSVLRPLPFVAPFFCSFISVAKMPCFRSLTPSGSRVVRVDDSIDACAARFSALYS